MINQIFGRKNEQEKTLLNKFEELLDSKCEIIIEVITEKLDEISDKLEKIIPQSSQTTPTDTRSNELTTPWILLTPRERVVLELIVQGKTNKEIAADIYLSEGGVKNIITKLLKKFEVIDRTQLAVRALMHNVVNEEMLSVYDRAPARQRPGDNDN